MKQGKYKNYTLITAGSTYLDIDAYACCVAMAELLRLKGEDAIAYSRAPANYSVCDSLVEDGQISDSLPDGLSSDEARYIVVDVSDPEFLKGSVLLERVVAIYDHHVGFEDYWQSRLGEGAHIEFIGAAATLVYREWRREGLQDRMSANTARLLVAAILDNTLNLTSKNTTREDIEAFRELCEREAIGDEWCAAYFSDVQSSVVADLKNALFCDIKTVRNNPYLPSRVAQITVWDAESVLARLPDIREWFAESADDWMINIIDIKHGCSYFVCDSENYQRRLEGVFDVRFESGVARSSTSYLRKEIIKKTVFWV